MLAARGARRSQGKVVPIGDLAIALQLRRKGANLVTLSTLAAVVATTAFFLACP